jgi:hypothetical protein
VSEEPLKTLADADQKDVEAVVRLLGAGHKRVKSSEPPFRVESSGALPCIEKPAPLTPSAVRPLCGFIGLQWGFLGRQRGRAH